MTTAIPPGMTLTLGEQDPEIKGKIVQDSEPLFEPPVPKRHRRPKGTPEGLHVETKTIITVIHRDRLIRPDGDEVFLLKVTEESIAIPWPEGMTALDAIIAWASKGMEKGE